jgi:hypothetical protein
VDEGLGAEPTLHIPTIVVFVDCTLPNEIMLLAIELILLPALIKIPANTGGLVAVVPIPRLRSPNILFPVTDVTNEVDIDDEVDRLIPATKMWVVAVSFVFEILLIVF